MNWITNAIEKLPEDERKSLSVLSLEERTAYLFLVHSGELRETFKSYKSCLLNILNNQINKKIKSSLKAISVSIGFFPVEIIDQNFKPYLEKHIVENNYLCPFGLRVQIFEWISIRLYPGFVGKSENFKYPSFTKVKKNIKKEGEDKVLCEISEPLHVENRLHKNKNFISTYS